MGRLQPQSEHTIYGRSCSVCSHADLGEVDAGLVAHTPIAQLARQFGLSRDSLYRHVKFHLRPVIAKTMTETPATRPMALVERLADIANDARAARATAYASGNAQLGARLGDAETRALDSMAARFGIDRDSLAADYSLAVKLTRAVDRAMQTSPQLRALVVEHLNAEGATELADIIRQQFPETTIPEVTS
ncbi:hypothetical protein NS183_02915 [Microbacterium testaceum]|nr:hypothetical protein NS183_02915 [Microbacterium testaceum]